MGKVIKTATFIVICYLLASCHTARINTRSIEESTTHAKIDASMMELSTISQVGISTESILQHINERTYVSLVWYDTSVKDENGTHPVLAEMKVNSNVESETITEMKDSTAYNKTDSLVAETKSDITNETKIEDETNVEVKDSVKMKIIYIFTLVVLLLVLGRYTK